MNNRLKELITPQTILSYSSGCIDVCETLLSLKDENYKRLIIPSRGAYPFYDGAKTSLSFLTESPDEHMKFYSHFNLWLLPYTSDYGDAKIKTSSLQIRRFWTKILADSIRKENTPYTKFYSHLVDHVGSRFNINTAELTLEKHYKADVAKDEKFIFIDTAVSGKAIYEIINPFNKFNLIDYFIILVTDENGERLKPEYKNVIEREKNFGRLKQINVNKIFSEDASPLLNSGISSLVFPSLIETAYYQIPEFYNSGIVGGGLWFIDSVSHLRHYNPVLNGIRSTISTLIYSGLNEHFGRKKEWFNDATTNDVDEMIESLKNFNIFDSASTKKLIYDRITSKNTKFEENVDVTGSHVIRITLNSDFINSFLLNFKKE